MPPTPASCVSRRTARSCSTPAAAQMIRKRFLLRLSVQGDRREYQNHIRDHRQGRGLPHENRQGYIGRPRRVGALDASGTNPELDGADTVMVWGNGVEGAEQMYADLCWKLDNGFTDAYDPDAATVCGCPASRKPRTMICRIRGTRPWTALRAQS